VFFRAKAAEMGNALQSHNSTGSISAKSTILESYLFAWNKMDLVLLPVHATPGNFRFSVISSKKSQVKI
jgi:hypothetical protein